MSSTKMSTMPNNTYEFHKPTLGHVVGKISDFRPTYWNSRWPPWNCDKFMPLQCWFCHQFSIMNFDRKLKALSSGYHRCRAHVSQSTLPCGATSVTRGACFANLAAHRGVQWRHSKFYFDISLLWPMHRALFCYQKIVTLITIFTDSLIFR
jgi:hypothetical protein